MKKVIAGSLILSILSFAFVVAAADGQWTYPEKWLETATASELGLTEFEGPPSLQEKVTTGKLPPVKDRLPKDPLVRRPYKSAGEYGGTLVVAATSPNAYNDITHARIPNLFTSGPGASKIVPEIAKSYEFKDNSTKLIIRLREGLKWSDGHPFTADDIMYWYKHEIRNPEISVWARSFWEVEGKFPQVTKLDDYTIEMKFSAPFRPAKGLLNYWTNQQTNFFEPAHYLKKYHKEFNPDVKELAEEQGYDNWTNMYYEHRDIYPGQQYPETPVLGPWVLKERSTKGRTYVRNPYYFAVDPEGKQLPYIDKLKVKVVSDRQVAVLQAMQGTLDIAGFILKPSGFPTYHENKTKGDYKVYTWRSLNGAEVAYALNLNHPDPVKREIFQDVRFRKALSLAINRKKINQFVYNGFGDLFQVTVDPNCSYYQKEWSKAYTEYNPQRAEELLQEMGLEKNKNGFYLRPDGKVLTINLNVPSGSDIGAVGMDRTNELVTKYWNKIGIKTNFKMISRDLFAQRVDEDKHDIAAWHVDRITELRAYLPGLSKFDIVGSTFGFAGKWANWIEYQNWLKNDKQGQKPSAKPSERWEPPEDVKDFLDLKESWYKAKTKKEYQELGRKVFDFYSEKLWLIGTLARALRPVIVQNNLKNIPQRLPWSDDTSFWRIAKPDQWYFEK